MTFVSLVKNSDPSKAVSDAVQLAGGLEVSGTVLIKPNLSCAKPSGSGLVTNVDVVVALVKMVAEQGAKPLVGDLPILGWDPKTVFDASGIRAIEQAGGELVDWSAGHIEISLPGAKTLKRVPIARPALEVDAIINVPVLKHHFLTHLSGGMKNLFGLVQPEFRPKVHVLGLDGPLVDFYEFLKPRIVLNVMDATSIAQSVRPAGPYYGPSEAKSAYQANMILASKDAVALDAVAARVIGIEPDDVEMVRIAASRRLGDVNPRTVGNARGASVKIKSSLLGKVMPYMEDAWTSQRLNRIAHPLAKRIYGQDIVSLKEVRREMNAIDPSRIVLAGNCTQCGLCVNACPTKNIALGSKPAFGSKCIKCFICVEICPGGVLAIQRK
ncbi:conserved hypothetical protein [Methanocella paludicola SANAE]|uniref:4Fe-4S ferredoxin-type domain-containing protein n=1 Tax=Methanocella paludicola (strain DSM 17711 / JCM 13418 / NBRC 101707 / SANAE) TaxID=304371 RepID=D1YUW4_METPS|nr:DUF362 domain-containing protein [Methanocella paludicola]BAI60236.1 conserved hypothetical protein [Methanocella paludicola SANAE]